MKLDNVPEEPKVVELDLVVELIESGSKPKPICKNSVFLIKSKRCWTANEENELAKDLFVMFELNSKIDLNNSLVVLKLDSVEVENREDSIILKISLASMQYNAATKKRLRRWNGFKLEGRPGRRGNRRDTKHVSRLLKQLNTTIKKKLKGKTTKLLVW